MSDSYFIDTNILVYAFDLAEPEKQQCSQTILEEGIRLDNAVVSTQVFGEFFNVVTKRIQNPMIAEEARQVLKSISALQILDISLTIVWRAIEVHQRYGTSYWDSLIVSSAEQAGCRVLYSEDFNHLQRYNGIQVINPFTA